MAEIIDHPVGGYAFIFLTLRDLQISGLGKNISDVHNGKI